MRGPGSRRVLTEVKLPKETSLDYQMYFKQTALGEAKEHPGDHESSWEGRNTTASKKGGRSQRGFLQAYRK